MAPAVRRLPRLSGYRIAIGAVLVMTLAFYLWTAGSTYPFVFPTVDYDIYNQLTTSFLHGHLYLPITPPPALLALHNPYNPVTNATAAFGYHDLALYKGHFYSVWGPTPVLTLFAPFRLTGLHMSTSFAVALYGFVGLGCAIVILHVLLARFVPTTPRWLVVVSAAGLALTNVVPFLLRRPVQYELAISCGYCFEMAGLALILIAVTGERVRRVVLALGSLCLGLAVGARPDLVLGLAAALGAGPWLMRRRGQGSSILIYALGPLVICGLALGAYNVARFGSFTDFGDRYQLAGIDQETAPFYRLQWIVPGLFSYLYVPVRLMLTFPHAFLMTATSDPFALPRGYIGTPQLPGAEPAGGVFTTMPITLLLFGLPVLWRRRRSEERGALVAATGLAGFGLALVILLSFAVFATTERYEVDFASLFLLPAFLIWAVLVGRQRPGSLGRRAIATLGILLTGFGAAVGTAISMTGYYDLLRVEHPATFAALEDVTGPLVTLATMIAGSPQITRVEAGPIPVTLPSGGSLTENGATVALGTNPVTVTVISPSSRHAGLTAMASTAPGAPPLSKIIIRVANGGARPDTVPLISPAVRLPVSLHTGLNRIRLTLAGTPTAVEELQLADLRVGS